MYSYESLGILIHFFDRFGYLKGIVAFFRFDFFTIRFYTVMTHFDFLSRLTAHGSRLTAHGSRLTAHGKYLILFWILSLLPLNFSAQNYCPSGTCGSVPCLLPIHLDYGLIIDQSFVNAFQGDEAAARMAAEEAFSIMAQKTRNSISGLTNANGNIGLNVFFNKIMFPNTIANDNWSDGDASEQRSRLQVAFSSGGRSCIERDGVIMFTGQSLGYDGSGNNVQSVCEVGTFSNRIIVMVVSASSIGAMSETIAHEIMHTFGFGHRNVSTNSNCNQCDLTNNPLMCTTGGPISLSSTCEGCLASTAFCITKCPCLSKKEPIYENNFTCPPSPGKVAFNIFSENPNPVLGCRTGGDIVTVTATFFNNNTTLNRNFRVRIGSSWLEYLAFEPDASLDFNCVKILANGDVEFRISDVNPVDCDSEQNDSFGPDEMKTLRFKVKYLKVLPSSVKSIPVISSRTLLVR